MTTDDSRGRVPKKTLNNFQSAVLASDQCNSLMSAMDKTKLKCISNKKLPVKKCFLYLECEGIEVHQPWMQDFVKVKPRSPLQIPVRGRLNLPLTKKGQLGSQDRAKSNSSGAEILGQRFCSISAHVCSLDSGNTVKPETIDSHNDNAQGGTVAGLPTARKMEEIRAETPERENILHIEETLARIAPIGIDESNNDVCTMSAAKITTVATKSQDLVAFDDDVSFPFVRAPGDGIIANQSVSDAVVNAGTPADTPALDEDRNPPDNNANGQESISPETITKLRPPWLVDCEYIVSTAQQGSSSRARPSGHRADKGRAFLDGVELGVRIGQLYLDGEELVVADPALGLLHCRCVNLLLVANHPAALGRRPDIGPGWGLVCKDCGRWTEGMRSLQSGPDCRVREILL